MRHDRVDQPLTFPVVDDLVGQIGLRWAKRPERTHPTIPLSHDSPHRSSSHRTLPHAQPQPTHQHADRPEHSASASLEPHPDQASLRRSPMPPRTVVEPGAASQRTQPVNTRAPGQHPRTTDRPTRPAARPPGLLHSTVAPHPAPPNATRAPHMAPRLRADGHRTPSPPTPRDGAQPAGDQRAPFEPPPTTTAAPGPGPNPVAATRQETCPPQRPSPCQRPRGSTRRRAPHRRCRGTTTRTSTAHG